MINEFEKKRLVDLFGVRIGLALCRSDVTYGILYDWYFNDVLIEKVQKCRSIGPYSAFMIYIKLQNYLFGCL